MSEGKEKREKKKKKKGLNVSLLFIGEGAGVESWKTLWHLPIYLFVRWV